METHDWNYKRIKTNETLEFLSRILPLDNSIAALTVWYDGGGVSQPVISDKKIWLGKKERKTVKRILTAFEWIWWFHNKLQ